MFRVVGETSTHWWYIVLKLFNRPWMWVWEKGGLPYNIYN